ncbi:hypothetical protein C6499_10950 [Candidatus Poribacteria bacterium]|nr:MAG: hypothetical protein C6499_10950 [Candidatus Poribacteria bacterium]
MNVRRYFESMSEPNDTMFVEIDDRHRFTRRGDDWLKFREDLIELLEQTISEALSKEFETATEDWISERV